jgi:hypothetical protein
LYRQGPRARLYAQAIVDWHHLRPIARGDLKATKRLAREALAAELERTPRIDSVEELVRLLRRTNPDRHLRVVA